VLESVKQIGLVVVKQVEELGDSVVERLVAQLVVDPVARVLIKELVHSAWGLVELTINPAWLFQ